MGLSWAATKSIITVALGQCGHEGHIDLDALSEHNKIEHDASLSRADAFLSGRHQVCFVDVVCRSTQLSLFSISTNLKSVQILLHHIRPISIRAALPNCCRFRKMACF